jgi:hypothetical protein
LPRGKPGLGRRGNAADSGGPAGARPKRRRDQAFTLAEVLAAMMFMVIVIPVAVEALHIASVSGEVAVRKAEASRVADRVLNENLVTTNWNQYATGTLTENGRDFRWTLRNEYWPADTALQLLTAEVEFSAQGRTYSTRLSTLANAPSTGLTGTGLP